jgi:Beta-propeller repeat
LQPASGGGPDAFVAKLKAAGSALPYSTYLGGNFGDAGLGIAVDGSGNAYVTGFTQSANFPTASPLQPAFGGGQIDAFITKITSIVPQTSPSVTCVASPKILWPPNGNLSLVTVSGVVTAGTQPILPGGTVFFVTDEYGQVQPSGSITLGVGGSYSFGVSLIAARNGNDQDGRTYIINVTTKDSIGNVGSCSEVVTVPHDQRS